MYTFFVFFLSDKYIIKKSLNNNQYMYLIYQLIDNIIINLTYTYSFYDINR